MASVVCCVVARTTVYKLSSILKPGVSWATTKCLYSRLAPLELPALVACSELVLYPSCCLWLAYRELLVLGRHLLFGHAVKTEVPVEVPGCALASAG